MVLADKAANNVIVVCWLLFNTLKQELFNKETSLKNELSLKRLMDITERQDKFPTMYWLPKLHKIPYKDGFIANSSSCSTTEFPASLTACPPLLLNLVSLCTMILCMNGQEKYVLVYKKSGEVFSKLKSRGFPVTSLSTYEFSRVFSIINLEFFFQNTHIIVDTINWILSSVSDYITMTRLRNKLRFFTAVKMQVLLEKS